jgi:hypothetical protein
MFVILAKENREPILLNSRGAFAGRRELYASYKRYLFATRGWLHTCLTKNKLRFRILKIVVSLKIVL